MKPLSDDTIYQATRQGNLTPETIAAALIGLVWQEIDATAENGHGIGCARRFRVSDDSQPGWYAVVTYYVGFFYPSIDLVGKVMITYQDGAVTLATVEDELGVWSRLDSASLAYGQTLIPPHRAPTIA